MVRRKLYKGGKYSLVVSIPKALLKMLGWRTGQYVEVKRTGRTLQVKDARSKRRKRK